MTSINLNHVTLWQANFYLSLEYIVISCSLEGRLKSCGYLFTGSQL